MAQIPLSSLPAKYQQQVLQKLQAQAATKGNLPVAATAQAKETKNKYGAQKTEVNGIVFDSKKEASRYRELMYALEQGYIAELRLQKEYTLQEACMLPNGHKVRAIRYRADFVYRMGQTLPPAWDTTNADREFWAGCYPGQEIIEDTKGVRTDVFRMKAKWMAEQGHEIREL